MCRVSRESLGELSGVRSSSWPVALSVSRACLPAAEGPARGGRNGGTAECVGAPPGDGVEGGGSKGERASGERGGCEISLCVVQLSPPVLQGSLPL